MNENEFKLRQTDAQVQDLLDKLALLPTRAELDAMLDKKMDKPTASFATANGALIYVLDYGEGLTSTVYVGDPELHKAIAVWAVQDGRLVIPFGSGITPLNPTGCTEESIGVNLGFNLCNGSMVWDPNTVEGYISDDFSIGKVFACAANGNKYDMVCEIIHGDKAIDGWYFVVPQAGSPDVGYIQNFID